jgi:hypothetical protein
MAMPIYRRLHDVAFEPEHIKVMIDAFEDVCRQLGLAKREDPKRDIVAKAIIECAQTEERNVSRLRECARAALHAPSLGQTISVTREQLQSKISKH